MSNAFTPDAPATSSAFTPAASSAFTPDAPAAQGPYDQDGLSKLWVQAGGDPKDAPLMANVALNESSGKHDAKNSYTQDGKTYTTHGLWQISDINGPGNYDDPLENAKKAVAMHRSSGMAPWEDSRYKGGQGGWSKFATRNESGHTEADFENKDRPAAFTPAPKTSSFTPAQDGMPTALQSQFTNTPHVTPGQKPVASNMGNITDGMTKAIDYASAGAIPAVVVARDGHFQEQQRKKLSGQALEDFNKKLSSGVVDPDVRPNEYKLQKTFSMKDLKPENIHKLVEENLNMTGAGPGSYSDVVDAITNFDKGSGLNYGLQKAKPAIDAAINMLPQAANPTGAIARLAGGTAALAVDALKNTGVLDRAGRVIQATKPGAAVIKKLHQVQDGFSPYASVRRGARAEGIDPDLAEQTARTFVAAPARAKSNAVAIVDKIYTNSTTGKKFTPDERIEIERLSEGLQPKVADTSGELMRAAQDVRDIYTRFTGDQTALDLMTQRQVFDPSQYTFRGGDVYKPREVTPEQQNFWDEYKAGNYKTGVNVGTKNEHKTFSNYDEAEPYLDPAKYDPADQLLSYLTSRGTSVGRERAIREMRDIGLIHDMPLLDKTGNLVAAGPEVDAVAGRLANRTARSNAGTQALNDLNSQRVKAGKSPLSMNDVAQMQKAVREKGKFRNRSQEAQIAADESTRMAGRATTAAQRTEQVAGDAMKGEIDKRVAALDKLNATKQKAWEMGQQGDREAAGKSLIAATEASDKISLELDAMREKVQRTAENVYGHFRSPSPNEPLNKATEAYYDAVMNHGPESPEAEAALKMTDGMQRVDEPRADIYAPVVGRIQDIYEAAKELPPGAARAKVLNMLTHVGKRGVKGPMQISDSVQAEKLLKQTQQAMSRVANAGRDVTSARIVRKLEDLSQSLERGIAADDARLYARKTKIADPAHRAAAMVTAGSAKAADRLTKLTDKYDFAKQSEGDVQAFRSAFNRAMQHAVSDEKERLIAQARWQSKGAGYQPFVENSKDAVGNAAMGSPTLKFAVADPDVVRFFASMGAATDDAEGMGSFIGGMNRLTRMGMIANPVVHAGWNLGTHYLAAGGAPTFFTTRLWQDPSAWGKVGSRTGQEWLEEADRWNALVHMADTHPLFGGSYAKNILDAPDLHDPRQAMNAGVTQMWHQNQRIVFDSFETRYSVDLFRKFVDEDGLTPQAAGIKVRRTLGDYTNIARLGVEGFLKKALLFYPWMKTAIPFWIKTLATKPSFVAIPGIGIRRFNQAEGDPDVGNENPFTIDMGKNADGGRKKMTYPGPQKWIEDLMNVIAPRNADVDPIGSRFDGAYKLIEGHLRPWGVGVNGAVNAGASILDFGLPAASTYAPGVKAQDPNQNFNIISNRDLPAGQQIGQIVQHYGEQLPGVELAGGLGKGVLSKDPRSLAGVAGGFQYDTDPHQRQANAAQSSLDRALSHAKGIKTEAARAAAIAAAHKAYDTKMKALQRPRVAPATHSAAFTPDPAAFTPSQ